MTWRPLLSTGSLGMVPPLRRYYGTLRLPAVLLDPFDFFTSRYHRFRPWFAPLGRGRPTGGQEIWGSGLLILSRWAQLMGAGAAGGGTSAWSAEGVLTLTGTFGMFSERSLALGASTP
jgi:hypothetical protein